MARLEEAARRVGRLILRERDARRLLRRACEILVESDACLAAWIAAASSDGAPAFWAEAGWGEAFEPLAADLAGRRWPRCQGGAWEAALLHDGRTLGLLALSFDGGRSPDAGERGLVEELASDLALALHAIEAEEQRGRAGGESRDRALFDELPVGAVLLDAQGNVVQASRLFGRFLGAQPRELTGLNLLKAAGWAGMDVSELRADLEARLAGREGLAELTFRRRSGELATVSIRSVAMPREGGQGHVLYLFDDVTERRRVEASLRLKNQIFDRSIAAMAILDLRGIVVEANAALLSLWGFDRQADVVGAAWWNLFEGSHPLAPVLAGLEAAGEWEGDLTGSRGDGSAFVVHAQAITLTDGRGQVVGYQMAAYDATERRRREQQLRESEERFRLLLEHLPAGVVVTDGLGRVTLANGQACALLGLTVGQLLGREAGDPPLRLLRGDGSPVEPEEHPVQRVLRTRAPVLGLEVGVCHASTGERGWGLVSAFPVLDGPVVRHVIVTFVDITERKRAEERDRLQSEMLDDAPVGIVVYDADGGMLYANRSAARLHGYSLEEFLGRNLDELLPPGPRQVRPGKFVRILQGEELAFETVHLRKGGEALPVHVHARRVDWQGQPAVLSVKTDLTERRRTEEERRRLQASLAQSDRLASMGMLAAGVAHEINNPLAYSLYNLESVATDLGRQARQLVSLRNALTRSDLAALLSERVGAELESLEALQPAVWSDLQLRFEEALLGNRRIKDIVRGLSTFSRVEDDRHGAVDVRRAIESALSIASNEVKYRARVERGCEATAPVVGSEGRISQVFLNLVINAAHAIHEGDVEHNFIRVRTWQEGATVLAEVQDSGCGIPAEDLERIFDPFFTTKPTGIGSGLGLSIVRNIVTGYGGSIEVSSEVGKGTRFLIRLPAAASAAAALPPPGPTEAEQAEPVPGRILVVDDEAGIRGALRRILRKYEVVEAESGEACCAILEGDQRFDLILCDMMMPTMAGMDVHRWLRERMPALAARLVFVTGGAFTPAARAYLGAVGGQTVEKPFDAATLRKLVAERVQAARAGAG